MAHTADLQEALYREWVGHIKKDDKRYRSKKATTSTTTAPRKASSTLFAVSMAVWTLTKSFLDLNEEAEGQAYLRLGVYSVSPDHKLLAYSFNIDGYEDYTIYVKDLTTGDLLANQIKKTSYSFAWISDSKTFYYTTQNEAKPHL